MIHLNNAVVVFTFFLFRLCFYQYAIFWKIQDFAMYRYKMFWQTYSSNEYPLCYFCIGMFMATYMVNIIAFSKMVYDQFEVLGLDKAIKNTERRVKND